MLDFDKNELCVGCSACSCACPVSAVRMVNSERGFYISEVDESKCVKCGKCEKVCPVLNGRKKRDFSTLDTYYAFSLNMEDRLAGSSGGIFYELAKSTINHGGIVCGCAWDENYVARHICTDCLDIVKEMRLSKYVQSNMRNSFFFFFYYVKARDVMFVGTPCQATALRNFIGDSNRLLICAVVCGGVPSPEVWKLYKEALEKKVGSRIKYLNMRTKVRSWLLPSLEVHFENGTKVIEVLTQNLYGANFFKGLQISKACMNCSYKLDTVRADIIMGDHWGIDPVMLKKSRDKGMSSVICLSDRGKKAFNDIKSGLFSIEGDTDAVIASHHVLMRQHESNPNQDSFFADLHKTDILSNFQKYSIQPKRNFFKRILFKTNSYEPFYKAIWLMRHRNRNS